MSRQWLSRITPVSSPHTVVTSPPSVTLMFIPFGLRISSPFRFVTLMSVLFSLRIVAIPVRNTDVRTVQSPYRRLSSTHDDQSVMH